MLNEESMARKEKWKLTRQDLGRGNFAVIYKATDPEGRAIACKVTTLKPLSNEYRTRILKSLGIQRFIKDHSHPNICSIYEIFMTAEKLYIFCEAMSTDLLKKIKKEAPFKEETALSIGKDVAEGLAYLHSLGIAHERIRPGHVLLDESPAGSGRAKITGLGWATVFFDPEKHSLIPSQGSKKQKFHHFFAPEVMKDAPYDASIADIWSLGTLINVMLTKDWPFEQHNPHPRSVMWKLSFKKARVDLSDTVYNILNKCYSEDPASRGDIFDVLHAFPSN